MSAEHRAKPWSDCGIWEGEGLRREVFFFRSGGVDLYGSLYAPASLEPRLGVLLCNSWGFEGDLASRLLYPLALSVAEAGGAAVVFHYPGFGDSDGDLGAVTMEVLAESAVDALRESARRQACGEWVLAGAMLGASVASIAAGGQSVARRLLLVQPALRPAKYFARLERASRRSSGGLASKERFAFGYPLTGAMLDSAARADDAVATALAGFHGDGAAVRHSAPSVIEGLPEGFAQVCAEGTWRFGTGKFTGLLDASARHLRSLVAGA
ncbi:MAG TPA: hypothetical protein VFM94_05750 [Solirubrobacterales bacterium]|nr:hypothetical protein [Solirubrobacterales bacterium]